MVLTSMPDGDPLKFYRYILASNLYQEALARTFYYSLIATLGTLILGYPLAYYMVRGKNWIRLAITALVVVPMFVALLVRTFGWMMIFSRTGPISRLLLEVGLTDELIVLMYTTVAVQIGMVAVLLPFMVLPLYATMRRIDGQLLQAARVLGAPPTAVFGQIFLPLSLPGVFSGVIIVFILSLGFYITPDLLGGSSNQVYAVLLAKAVKMNFTRPAFPAAMSVILLMITLIVLTLGARLISLNSLWAADARQELWQAQLARRGPRGWWEQFRDETLTTIILWIGQLPRFLQSMPGIILASLAVFITFVPILVAFVFSFARSIFLPFPPTELTLKWYAEFASSDRWFDAISTSLVLGVVVAVIVTLISALTAIAMVRGRFPGKNTVMALILSPLIIPHVVLAVGLWHLFFVLRLSGTFWGVAIAHMIPAIPLTTIVIAANLQTFDKGLEQVARGLGASPIRAFASITVPILRPGFLVAAFFGFLVSLDELVFTLFLAGYRIRTLPLRLWEDLHVRLDPVLAVVSVVEVVLVLLVLTGAALVLRYRQRRTGEKTALIG
jgi:putative spermidine/putrescine transport system permease protein|tara:strand:- start:150 stop:1817 length:1668 start_codon:yes stop_codon:yes gene_type:complete